MNLIIDHIDGNIKNNNVNNLQIITNGKNRPDHPFDIFFCPREVTKVKT